MGWADGSRLFSALIRTVKAEGADHETRKRIYLRMIPAFEDLDWDTQDECRGEDPAYDAAFRELYVEGGA